MAFCAIRLRKKHTVALRARPRVDRAFADSLSSSPYATERSPLESVIAELKKKNPGYDGTVFQFERVENEFILRFSAKPPGKTPTPSDMIPLRDISPLQGLNLTKLYLDNTYVEDLTPLKDARQLWFLSLNFSPVRDLAPLVDVPIQELFLTGCQHVKSLDETLKMPLNMLSIQETGITDLTPLKGKQLDEFYCDDELAAKSLDLLREMKLRYINDQSSDEFFQEN